MKITRKIVGGKASISEKKIRTPTSNCALDGGKLTCMGKHNPWKFITLYAKKFFTLCEKMMLVWQFSLDCTPHFVSGVFHDGYEVYVGDKKGHSLTSMLLTTS